MEEDVMHLNNVLRHIGNVRESCKLLGDRLIEKGEKQIGIELIGLGQIHDYSKIHNMNEFRFLRESCYGTPEFNTALLSHVSTNMHHPEAWSSIQDMPRVYMAEMVCDWKSRASEFGTDIVEWVKEKATQKFKFSTRSKIYREIKDLFNILLDRKF